MNKLNCLTVRGTLESKVQQPSGWRPFYRWWNRKVSFKTDYSAKIGLIELLLQLYATYLSYVDQAIKKIQFKFFGLVASKWRLINDSLLIAHSLIRQFCPPDVILRLESNG